MDILDGLYLFDLDVLGSIVMPVAKNSPSIGRSIGRSRYSHEASNSCKWRLVCLFGFFGCGVFYYLALFSFSPFDPTYYTGSSPYPEYVANYGGRVGAEMSAHFLTWFGFGAYILPLFVALFVIYRRAYSSMWEAILRWGWVGVQLSFLVALSSTILSLLDFRANSGGWLGENITQLLGLYVGEAGSWMIAVMSVIWVACFKVPLVVWKNHILTKFVSRLYHLWLLPVVKDSWRRVCHVCKSVCYGFLKRQYDALKMRGNPLFHKLFVCLRLYGLRAKIIGFQARKTRRVEYRDLEDIQNQASESSGDKSQKVDLPGDTALLAADSLKVLTPLVNPVVAGDVEGVRENHASDDVAALSHRAAAPMEYPSVQYMGMFKEQTYKKPLFKKDEAAQRTAEVLVSTLADFHIGGKLVGLQTGPRVRTFEFEPNSGIKQTKLTTLVDDIARSLKVESVIIQPMIGKSSMGIQVPRSDPVTVYLGDILQVKGALQKKMSLPIGLGISPSGEAQQVDLAMMPHLLIAGATGSGKSVGIHALINSIICARSPGEVRLVLVDPKMLELSVYNKMPHLAAPVITDAKQACLMLEWAVQEMESRYRLMQAMQVRNISEFNVRWQKMSAVERDEWREHFPTADHMPYLVMIIDELADLMLVAPKDVEGFIQRLSQKARASGIHLVLATQRPSVDVITGVIKANFPARIAFQVVSKHDSRTILDQIGAEKLLGRGDMLFQNPSHIRPQRLQGAFVSDEEIRKLLRSLQKDYEISYFASLQKALLRQEKASEQSLTAQDPKWEEALKIAEERGHISASFLQRRLQVGYNRAARMIEAMEAQHLIERSYGAKPRAWIASKPVDHVG